MRETVRISATTLVRRLGSVRNDFRLPVYRSLAETIRSALLDGRLAVGTGLPSEREFANKLGVSRTTVVAAYSLLRDQGWLESRHGSGSWLLLPKKVNKDIPHGPREQSAHLTNSAFGSGGIYGWDGDSRHQEGATLSGSPPIDLIDLTTACPDAPLAALSSAILAVGDSALATLEVMAICHLVCRLFAS